MFLRLATKSLINRRGSVLLTLLAMAVGIFVLLGVEHTRNQARESFANTVSGIDLIVGARTGSLNLLLYSVFRVGAATNEIEWESFNAIASSPNVAWAIPIALGESHKGYRVMGTTQAYFDHFSYGSQRKLVIAEGQPFTDVYDVVLGSEVARKLGYSLGDELIVAHGIAEVSYALHDDSPFTVVGILAPTGTPVDQTLHVSLKGIEAIHIGWEQGVKLQGSTELRESSDLSVLEPDHITAAMLGLKSRAATFKMQRLINEFADEPLLAILPGVALTELWQMMGVLENVLRLISLLVLGSAVLGLAAMLLASIRERDQEIQLLRVIGAPPLFLFLLIELEALLITAFGVALGALVLFLCVVLVDDWLMVSFGLHVSPLIFSGDSVYLIAAVLLATLVAAATPSFNAYRRARLVD
ncbi:MAG: ABC transporter permease [Pseudomonadota bacterium]